MISVIILAGMALHISLSMVPTTLRLLPQGRGVARAKREVRAQLDNLKMANFRNKEREEIVREVLSIQPILIGSFFTLMILSCLLLR